MSKNDKIDGLEFAKNAVMILESAKCDLKEAESLEQARNLINESLLVAKLAGELYQHDTISQEKIKELVKQTLN